MRLLRSLVVAALCLVPWVAQAQQVPNPVNGPASATVGHCVQFNSASGNSVSDAGSTCGSGAFTAPTMAFVGDSFTNYGGSAYTTVWMAITSTTAGNSSITLSNSYSGGFFAPGDIAYLCSSNSSPTCSGTGEQITVGNYSGGGSTTLPISGTLQNSGETFIQAYTTRMPSYNFQGWFFWANAISGWPMNLTGFFGLPGATVSQIAGKTAYTDYLGVTSTTDQVAKAIATGAKYIHIMEGANDLTTGYNGAVSDFAILQSQIAEVQAAGDIPIVGTIPMNTGGSITSGQCPTPTVAQGNYVTYWNYRIRELAAYNNVIVVDYYKALTRPDTGNWVAAGTSAPGGGITGLPSGVGYTPDCTHPNFLAGAMAMARAFSDTLVASNIIKTYTSSDGSVVSSSYVQHNIASQVGTVNFETMYTSTFGANNAGNMMPNGGMSNAVGSGATADSWASNNGRTPSQGSNVFSVYQQTAQDGNGYSRGYWQRILIPAGSDWGQAYVSAQDVVSVAGQNLSSATWQVGDTVYGSVRVKMNCFSTTYQASPTIAVNFQNGATVIGRSFGPAYKSAQATFVYPSEAGVPDTGPDPASCPASAILRTPNIVVPVGTTRIVMWLMLNGEGAYADFTDAEVRKVL